MNDAESNKKNWYSDITILLKLTDIYGKNTREDVWNCNKKRTRTEPVVFGKGMRQWWMCRHFTANEGDSWKIREHGDR